MSKPNSALISTAALVALVTCVVSTEVLRASSYGWSLFLITPFLGGAIATGLFAHQRVLKRGELWALSAWLHLFTGLGLMAFAIEGLICLAMALPLTFTCTLMGGLFAHRVLGFGRTTERPTRTASLGLIPLLGLGALVEPMLREPPELRAVTTRVEINASAEEIWDEVIGFSPIHEPLDGIFALGIAAPLSAEIDGEGVGAIRRCTFTTGSFIEPITHWEPGRRLAFDVIESPVPMTETSFYADLQPPHLHDMFASERGEFVIRRGERGALILEGTTWYRQKIWPQVYWNLLADQILHDVHERVLGHIRDTLEHRS